MSNQDLVDEDVGHKKGRKKKIAFCKPLSNSKKHFL